MNLVVLALAAFTVSPALSAPTSYRTVHHSRGISSPSTWSLSPRTWFSGKPASAPATETASAPATETASALTEQQHTNDSPGTPPPTYAHSSVIPSEHDSVPGAWSEPESVDKKPQTLSSTPAPGAGSETTSVDGEKTDPHSPTHDSPATPPRKMSRVGAGGIGFAAGVATAALAPKVLSWISGQSTQGQTKRTSEAFEGPANGKLMERAFGDHDLDK